MMQKIEDLVRKTIQKIFINRQGDWIQFETDGGPLRLVADADCCSHTWINDVEGVSALVGGTVVSVEAWTPAPDHDMGADKINEVEAGELKLYGYRFRTNKGFAAVEFRNASNGYYGGSLERADPEARPGGEELESDDWTAKP